MKKVLLTIPGVISCCLLAAHFLRVAQPGLVILFLSAPLLLLLSQVWTKRALQLLLAVGALVWCLTLFRIYQLRVATGQPYLRLLIILGSVALFCLLAAWLLEGLGRPEALADHQTAALVVFLLSMLSFTIVQLKVRFPVILLERFLTGGGWLEAFWLSVYAGWLLTKVSQPKSATRWRPRIWGLFSFVFFLQLGLGLLGWERFLMTGELHFPIPALIIGGPIYRGAGFFMLILFSVTVLLVGPAWCSWLCYIGSWDDLATRFNKKRHELPRWRRTMRIAIFVLVIVCAYLLRIIPGSELLSGSLALGFGLIGVALMLTWSKDSGHMTHCTAYCPLGVLANTLGKISPFRLRITQGCDQCGACSKACRYDCLGRAELQSKKTGNSCTLCGDCLARCKERNIEYSFLNLSAEQSRVLFLSLVVTLHAVFLGVARI